MTPQASTRRTPFPLANQFVLKTALEGYIGASPIPNKNARRQAYHDFYNTCSRKRSTKQVQ